MKKLILSAIVAAGVASGAYAQGTVAFQNFGWRCGRQGLYRRHQQRIASGAISLELFWGPVGDTAAQILAVEHRDGLRQEHCRQRYILRR